MFHRFKLPVGKRHTDPKSNRQPRLWRVGLYIRKNPVLAAFTISLIVAGIGLYLVLVNQGQLREAQKDIRKQADAVAVVALNNRTLTQSSSENRVQALRLLCTQNTVMLLILHKNSGAAGGQQAINALTAINCQRVLKQAEDQARASNEPTHTEHGLP